MGGTVTIAEPDAAPALAVTVATPSPIPDTIPMAFTSATRSSADSHENAAPATVCPFASRALAVS